MPVWIRSARENGRKVRGVGGQKKILKQNNKTGKESETRTTVAREAAASGHLRPIANPAK